jgi:hypothetical protein
MKHAETAAWLAGEAAIRDRIIQARAHAGHPWRLREACPSTRQHYFLLRHRDEAWVGRRYADPQRGGPANAVSACHLLGNDFRFAFGDGESDLDVTLRSSRDAAAFFAEAAGDPAAELVFPFPALDKRGQEWVCPPQYWAAAAQHAALFADDERHLRALCARTLRERLPPAAQVHDPACSTGDFLAAMARRCPGLHFTGSDLSPAMVDTARRRHARLCLSFTCADAASLPRASVDALIVRFLNAEVVRHATALALFRQLSKAVRPGGIVVLFGHTGILVPVHAEAARLGWLVDQCTARTPDGRGIFQWYVLQRPLPRAPAP